MPTLLDTVTQLSEKTAESVPTTAYVLKGELYLSGSGWLLLRVPNELGTGAFKALGEPGAELPVQDSSGHYNAHISVMRPEEIAAIGGPDKITQRGRDFSYTLGPVKEILPANWKGVSKCWAIDVNSPDLQALRRSYGLTSLPNNNKFRFHISFAIRKVNALRNSVIHSSALFAAIDDKKGS